jgi:membrane protein DedA with SNARE-associated domain
VLRIAHVFRITPERLATAERWLLRGGAGAILVARVLPGTRINASFAAGGLRLPLRTFVAGVLPSTVLWLGMFTALGYALGDTVTPLLPWFDRIVLGLAVVALLAGAVIWRRRRQAAKRRTRQIGAAA